MDFITVSVGKFPGALQTVALNGDRTVGAALNLAGLAPGELAITIDGVPATLGSPVSDGQTILLTSKIKGN